MAIKLIKACKELNIGMKTLLDFCSMMGYPVDADPNIRLDDDIMISICCCKKSLAKMSEPTIEAYNPSVSGISARLKSWSQSD